MFHLEGYSILGINFSIAVPLNYRDKNTYLHTYPFRSILIDGSYGVGLWSGIKVQNYKTHDRTYEKKEETERPTSSEQIIIAPDPFH